MKILAFAALATAAAALAAPAAAQDSGGVSVAVSGGTLGVGPELGYRASEKFGLRASATFLGVDRTVESDGIEYDGSLDLESYGAALDLYPFGGGFRLSGGARMANNGVGLLATPTTDVEVGDMTYTPEEIGTLTGRVEPRSFAPTLTLGYGGGASKGVKFGIDAGVMFQGAPKVTRLTATGTLANDPDFQAELAREKAEIEADLDSFKLFPIVQLSLGYRF